MQGGVASAMFEAQSINAEHKDLIHDVAYDFYGQRMATCSSDQFVKVKKGFHSFPPLLYCNCLIGRLHITYHSGAFVSLHLLSRYYYSVVKKLLLSQLSKKFVEHALLFSREHAIHPCPEPGQSKVTFHISRLSPVSTMNRCAMPL